VVASRALLKPIEDTAGAAIKFGLLSYPAMRVARAGYLFGAGLDAAGQYYQSGEVRLEQTAVAGTTGALGFRFAAGLPAVSLTSGAGLGSLGMNAATGGATATANTWFNNSYYGEDTSLWIAGSLGFGAGGFGAYAGRVAQTGANSLLPSSVLNNPRIPTTGATSNFPAQGPVSPVSGQIGSGVSNTTGGTPSFICLDNGLGQNNCTPK
jgi:hypothetical protein